MSNTSSPSTTGHSIPAAVERLRQAGFEVNRPSMTALGRRFPGLLRKVGKKVSISDIALQRLLLGDDVAEVAASEKDRVARAWVVRLIGTAYCHKLLKSHIRN
jgi:orotate phosphoribosyltransferase